MQFFEAGTLAHTSDIDMLASTHEKVRSPDGGKVYASVYGGGTFGRNEDASRHIAVIYLASRTLEHLIDVGAPVAPHSVMMDGYGTLWSTGEPNDLVMAIDPRSDKVERVDLGGSPHPIAIGHATGKRSLRSRPKASLRWSIRKPAA